MTPEERARQVCDGDWTDDPSLFDLIEAAIRAAVAEERAACAKVASDMADEVLGLSLPGNLQCQQAAFGRKVFAAIRARGACKPVGSEVDLGEKVG